MWMARQFDLKTLIAAAAISSRLGFWKRLLDLLNTTPEITNQILRPSMGGPWIEISAWLTFRIVL